MSITNQITAYEVVLMGDSAFAKGSFLGWIRLTNGADDSGYVYLEDNPSRPHLGGVGRLPRPYVVMSRPVSEFETLLMVLNDGRPKVIRFDDNNPQEPSAFIEHVGTTLDPEQQERLGARIAPPRNRPVV